MGEHKNILKFNLGQTKSYKTKNCLICSAPFNYTTERRKYCSDKCKGKVQYINGRSSTENQYLSISGNWKRYFQRLCCRSNKRENLSWDDCINILEKQQYKCALSGVELTCNLSLGTKCLTNASLDRIEAGGPYIKENVQIVCRALNCFRTNTNLQEFIWWCKKVTEHQNGN